MAPSPKRFWSFLASRWRSWLPPIIVVVVVVVALMLLAPHEQTGTFHYKLF
jgi:hypothetical protein